MVSYPIKSSVKFERLQALGSFPNHAIMQGCFNVIRSLNYDDSIAPHIQERKFNTFVLTNEYDHLLMFFPKKVHLIDIRTERREVARSSDNVCCVFTHFSTP
jgi:hypothetical protein